MKYGCARVSTDEQRADMQTYVGNPKNVAASIKRLTREIAEIDNFFYKANETDDRLLYEVCSNPSTATWCVQR